MRENGLMDEVRGRVTGVKVVLTWCETPVGGILLDGPGGLDVTRCQSAPP